MARRRRDVPDVAREDRQAYLDFREVQRGRLLATGSQTAIRVRDLPPDVQDRRIKAALEARRRWAGPDDWSHRVH